MLISMGFILGLNSDEMYLSGISYKYYPFEAWLIVIVSIILIAYVVIHKFCMNHKIVEREKKDKEVTIDVVYVTSIVMLLAISSTTIRVEMRWMFSPYILLVIWLIRCIYTISSSQRLKMKSGVFLTYVLCTILFSIFCLRYSSNIYYWNDCTIGDKLAKAIYGTYGDATYDKKYVIVSPYVFQGGYGYEDVLGQFDLNKDIDMILFESVDQLDESDCIDRVIVMWNENDYDVYETYSTAEK